MRAFLQDVQGVIGDVQGVIGERPCGCCGARTPAWALYEEAEGWQCGACILAAARAAPPPAEPETSWESERGKYLKAERNRLLDQWRWTIMPDSPLSEACQAEFLAWLKALNRMTVDSTPDAWTFPPLPQLHY